VKVVDLSLKILPSLKVFPGSPQPCFVPWSSFSSHGYDSEAVFMSTHTGTHIDAPSHFVPGKPSIDRIPASRFVAEGIVVKIPKKANGLVKESELKGFDIREDDAVVIATGWETQIRANNYMSENPGLSAGAAGFLARKKVSIVAIDGPSIDAGADAAFTAHKILLGNDILVVENLRNLQSIPKIRFTFVVAPLKLQGSTGSPIRALALIL
jgi:arylformamidase